MSANGNNNAVEATFTLPKFFSGSGNSVKLSLTKKFSFTKSEEQDEEEISEPEIEEDLTELNLNSDKQKPCSLTAQQELAEFEAAQGTVEDFTKVCTLGK